MCVKNQLKSVEAKLDRSVFKKKKLPSLLTVNIYQSTEPMKIYQHNFLLLKQQGSY